ncbi:MAG TPA: NADH:flavin oxidoreductase [Syntrophorhabdaceae bacterium]|nr:NADH:flavin oxidoreductase [Syntrophorhabdaceae bacterium]
MSSLFESTSLKHLTVANRFVRSATWEGLADKDGAVTRRLIDMSSELARGGVGLIITGHAYVSREGQAAPWQLGVYSDDLIHGLTRMTGAIHDSGGKLVMQLAHAGALAPEHLIGSDPVGAWPVQRKSGLIGRAMTQDEIKKVVKAFASAASRAKTAGFDGVQIHAAHGYLLSQFLSPYFNKRTDAYGGSIENRTRLILEVVHAIRQAVGQNFPILAKLNCEDFLPDGLTVEEMVRAAALLQENGLDAIEMSGGTVMSGNRNPSRPGKPGSEEPEAYYETAASRYKERIDMPLVLVGGIRTYETAERLVARGVADYVALCRPLIREPGIVARWQSGETTPSLCVSDNGCFKPGTAGDGIRCVVATRSPSGD